MAETYLALTGERPPCIEALAGLDTRLRVEGGRARSEDIPGHPANRRGS